MLKKFSFWFSFFQVRIRYLNFRAKNNKTFHKQNENYEFNYKSYLFKKKQLFVDFGIIGANTFWYSVFFLLKLRYCIAWGNSEKFFAHAMYTTTNRCAIHKRQFSQHLGVQSCICVAKSSFVKVISIVVNSLREKVASVARSKVPLS